jgi:hypothetical protein
MSYPRASRSLGFAVGEDNFEECFITSSNVVVTLYFIMPQKGLSNSAENPGLLSPGKEKRSTRHHAKLKSTLKVYHDSHRSTNTEEILVL